MKLNGMPDIPEPGNESAHEWMLYALKLENRIKKLREGLGKIYLGDDNTYGSSDWANVYIRDDNKARSRDKHD